MNGGNRASLSNRRARSLAGILDGAGPFEVIEQDRLRVEDQLDLVANDRPAAGKLVLPRDGEVVAVDARNCLKADPELRAQPELTF
jgi:hypothetical protein